MGLVVMAGLFLPRLGRAHTLGLSTASFDVGPDGKVAASFAFASADLLGRGRSEADLRAFVLDGVEVTADGGTCAPAIDDDFGVGFPLKEDDGLRLRVSYACTPPAETGEIAVTLFYLSALGPAHREIARITAGSATSEAVLSSDRRALVLQLPGASRRAALRRRGTLLVALTAAFTACLSALFVWRWRATRPSTR
jgi:hypothetical protein